MEENHCFFAVEDMLLLLLNFIKFLCRTFCDDESQKSVIFLQYDTIEEFNVDSKAEYTA